MELQLLELRKNKIRKPGENVKRLVIKKRILWGIYIVFTVLTLIGAIGVLLGKFGNAGYAVVPMVFMLMFHTFYLNCKKAIEENGEEEQ